MAVFELVQPADQQLNTVELVPEGRYQTVKYNALKHGVLAKLTVLPHEDATEFEALRDALIEEHQPSGPTETHLIEDLAAIMWRKRRILLAENAEINNSLLGVVQYKSNTPAKSAAPFMYGMPDKPSNWLDLIQATPEEVEQSQRETTQYTQKITAVMATLKKNGPKAYEKALRSLPLEDREMWAEWVAEEEYEPNAEGLKVFIEQHLWPIAVSMEKEALHHFAIKKQALGEGLRPAHLQNLCRYETHLDRKFERTLAMLIKLKELRTRT